MASADTFDDRRQRVGRPRQRAVPRARPDPDRVRDRAGAADDGHPPHRHRSTRPSSPSAGSRAGTTNNIIPETAEIEGTIRAVSEQHARAGPRRHPAGRRADRRGARRHGRARGRSSATRSPSNDAEFADVHARRRRATCSAPTTCIRLPNPVMGAEDFSYVLSAIPGTMMFLGGTPSRSRSRTAPRQPLQPRQLRRGMRCRSGVDALRPDGAAPPRHRLPDAQTSASDRARARRSVTSSNGRRVRATMPSPTSSLRRGSSSRLHRLAARIGDRHAHGDCGSGRRRPRAGARPGRRVPSSASLTASISTPSPDDRARSDRRRRGAPIRDDHAQRQVQRARPRRALVQAGAVGEHGDGRPVLRRGRRRGRGTVAARARLTRTPPSNRPCP